MAIRLLTVSGKITEIQQAVMGFFNGFGVLYALEILVLFGVLFFVSKVLRDNDATKLMLIYWFMIFAGGALQVFDGELMPKPFLLIYVIVLSAVMLIIFSVEVKKYFWDVHVTKETPKEKNGWRCGNRITSGNGALHYQHCKGLAKHVEKQRRGIDCALAR